jgi:hypothetical protein
MRLITQRSVWCGRFCMGFCNVSVLSVQFYSTDGASGRHKMISHILYLILYIGFHGLGSLHKIFISLSTLLSGLCMLYHNSVAYFPVISLRQSLISGIYIAVVITTWVVQWLRLHIPKGMNRPRHYPPHLKMELGDSPSSEDKQIQFLKSHAP